MINITFRKHIPDLFLELIILLIPSMILSTLSCDNESDITQRNNYPQIAIWYLGVSELDQEDSNLMSGFDFITVGEYNSESTYTKLKSLNPDQKHFVYVNFTELTLDWWLEFPVLHQIPAEWFLTQIGSYLSSDISDAENTIQVDDAGTEINPLFEPDDAVACEFETMKVIDVDYDNNILTVERGAEFDTGGAVRPSASHEQGTRIAAHTTFWPGSWEMNLSTQCPLIDAGTGYGPENWITWAMREFLPARYKSYRDGLAVDRLEYSQSYQILAGSARSIDPNCSNTLPADEYIQFNMDWHQGIINMLELLRKTVPDIPITGNSFGAYAQQLNGMLFESVPGNWTDDTPETYMDWSRYILGDSDVSGYIESCDMGYFPNYNLIETYQVETYDWENLDPLWDEINNPDYQRMRYGLTTALLGDGYFSYEICTVGHGVLGVAWFDEYDNAGAGKGYLGKPVGHYYEIADFDEAGKVFRRDYQNGIVICNPSEATLIDYQFEKEYKAINGSQCSDINNGEILSSISIPPRDGRILLNTE